MSNTIDLIEKEEIQRVNAIRAAAKLKKAVDAVTEEDLEAVKKFFPEVSVGDTVRVYVVVSEANADAIRIQAFEGIVIAKKNGGVRETFTVRRLSYGIGVERTFPVYSTKLDRVEIVRHGYTRRAKLYYLRDRKGKSAKLKEIKK